MRDRAHRVEEFVAGRIVRGGADRLVVAALDAINAGWGREPVASLARRFDLGRRQFNRRFTRSVGASPKQLSRLLRAQKAIACLLAGDAVDAVVDRCGFSDQSHFIRDVVAHSGRRPGDLARLVPSRPSCFFNSCNVDAFCGMAYL
jgi:transcriptional regulator GlxA family with amidase domain